MERVSIINTAVHKYTKEGMEVPHDRGGMCRKRRAEGHTVFGWRPSAA